MAKLVRVSTSHLEQADSPQHQLAYIDGEIGRSGWMDTGLTYQAELTGAVILDRPDIQRLLRDAAARKFDAIVLKSISRLGRDTLGLLMVKRLLDDLRVELVALADGYRSGRDPELIFLVHAERAQAGRQEIAKNVRAGIVQAARRGIWPAGTIPFGLRRDGRMAIGPDPETAPLVQLIFALRRQGRPILAIANHLNRELRVKAPAWWHRREQVRRLERMEGAERDERVQARLAALRELLITRPCRWTPRTIRLILANTAYYGELRYNRSTGERRIHGRLVRQPRPPADWVLLPCTPLLSREEWEAAQRAGADSDRLPPRAKGSDFLLSGLIGCGQCGCAMRSVRARPGAGRRGGDPKGYYVCRGSLEEAAHERAYLRATDLEQAVLARLRADLAGLTPPRLGSGRGRTARREAAPTQEALAEALADLAAARFFRREELRRGRMTEAEFRFEMAVLERQEDQLHAEAAAPPAGPGPDHGPSPAPEVAPHQRLVRLMRLEGEPAEVKRLLATLLRKVVVFPPDQVEIQTLYSAAELPDR